MGSELPEWARHGRAGWRYCGQERPPFAEPPGRGQESVWDYPRPPRLAPDARRIVVMAGDQVIADTRAAIRLLETASPPTFYLPPEDVDLVRLVRAGNGSRCEWKGTASYWDVVGEHGRSHRNAAWSYPQPFADYGAIRGYLAFYPAALLCTVDGELVRPQPGQFYGGWVTAELVGPFKGEPNSSHW